MKTLFRAAVFALIFAVLLFLCNTFLITTDTLSYLAMHEMTHRDDVEIAFVGSSIARNHFVPEIIEEETGLTPFNLALPYMSMQGSLAATKLMFEHHAPKYMVLVAEPYLFDSTRESTQTQFRLMPFLKNPIDRAAYYVDLCMQDDRWLDRLLIPREYCVKSPADFVKTLRHHTDVQHYYDAQAQIAQTASIGSTYQGSGFMHPDFNIAEAERMRIGMGRLPDHGVSALPEYSKDAIRRFVRLCEDNGAKPMVVIFPYITAAMLSTPDYLSYNALLEAFCAQNDIPCFNFAMAKEELMPSLDAYYQNVEHMSIDGAQAISRAFCDVFARYTAGEDVSSLFYQSREAYLASIDRVTNVWLTETAPNVFVADCHHGSLVTPEFAFVTVDAQGNETTLRDASDDPVYRGPIPDGATLRVYAWARESDEDAVYYDL